MEKREYSYEEIKTYYAFCEKQHISDDMKHQLYVCFILGINEKYIEQLRDEKISAEKRELLKEALLNDFPEEIYNSMLLSEDVSSCRQIRENYLMEKYAENNPALKKAEEQVKEFHKLLEQYKYRIESNEELAKAISNFQSVIEKAYEAQIKNLQDTSAAVSEEKEKRLEEKDKIIAKLESQLLQLEERHKEEKAALRTDMDKLIVVKEQTIENMETQRQQAEKEWQVKKEELETTIGNLFEENMLLMKENNQRITEFSQQAAVENPNSTENTTELRSEEKRKGFFERMLSTTGMKKKSETADETAETKNRHTIEEKKAMVDFIRTSGFDADQNNFLIACFKKGIPFERINQIAGKNLTVEQMNELLNFFNEGE